jgi:Raf kinase inhibitor-like YbhB/YbcL family protein
MHGASIRPTNIAHTMRVLFFVLLLASCQSGGQGTGQQQPSSGTPRGSVMTFWLQSPAFSGGGSIPKKFTCEGADVSPALQWSDPPANTQSFALIADDPDAPAGTWTHWVVYDLPAKLRQLPEGVSKQATIPAGGSQGTNDFGKTGYGGPCPPPGNPHRYFFRLYALGKKLDLKPGATKQQVVGAMQSHILGQAELMGTYQREALSH